MRDGRGGKKIAVALLAAAGLLLVGCGSKPSASPTAAKTGADAQAIDHGSDPWRISYNGPITTTPLLLSNGLFAVRLPSIGTGEKGQAELRFSDTYHPEGEEKLITFQVPRPAVVDESSNILTSEAVSELRQTLDLRTGAVETAYAWGDGLQAKVVTLVHPTKRVLVQRWELACDKRKASFSADFNSEASANSTPQNEGILNGTQIRYRLSSKTDWIDQTPQNWTSQKPFRSDLCWSFGDNAGSEPQTISFDQVYADAKAHWAMQWQTDIEIDGPVEDQQAIRSMLYYMRSGISPTAQIAPGPFGLANQTYNGHVFWDADVWMFPALALIDPERAKVIPDYRIRMAKAAEKNFREARSWAREKPNLEKLSSIDALQYPWESSVTGLEVSPTETKQQHHITATVLFGLDHAAALGLADAEAVQAIGKKAARFYEWRSMRIQSSLDSPTEVLPHLWTVQHTVSPDESFWGDDDLYTNCAAEWLMKKYAPPLTVKNPYEFYRPADDESFLNYTGDRLKGYKQAAGILAIYPLQDPQVEKQAAIMMERFADKVTANGPAMSDSVNALVWARLGQTEKAYETWRKSWKEFTNHPLMLFSEKRRKEETYFLTGAGGSLQSVLYGFLGFRIDLQKMPGAAWSVPLKDGRWLSVRPNLPKGWKKVTLRNFTVLGKKYTLTATHDDVRVTSGDN